jgi:ferredoxin
MTTSKCKKHKWTLLTVVSFSDRSYYDYERGSNRCIRVCANCSITKDDHLKQEEWNLEHRRRRCDRCGILHAHEDNSTDMCIRLLSRKIEDLEQSLESFRERMDNARLNF